MDMSSANLCMVLVRFNECFPDRHGFPVRPLRVDTSQHAGISHVFCCELPNNWVSREWACQAAFKAIGALPLGQGPHDADRGKHNHENATGFICITLISVGRDAESI
jgi:hypothetical protein